jgi:PIN domain nuclease of toxin-antitoxin system
MLDSNISVLPIELRHTGRLLSLPYHHKDPFDRLPAAQALAEQIPLVSGDSALDPYGITRIW